MDQHGPHEYRDMALSRRVLDAFLPGAGLIAAGAWWRGALLLVSWLALMAVAVLARGRIALVPAQGSLDDWIALITLISLLVAVWLGAQRELGPKPGDSQWRVAIRSFRRNRLALMGLLVLALLYAITLLAPFLAPYDPIATGDIVGTSYLPPSAAHWFGTDRLGRDVLSRVLYGARISLSIGFVATAISVVVGTLLGALAGYAGGRTDALIMRFTDVVLAFPRLILLILVVALFPPSITVIIIVLGLTQWPGTTRIVRGDVLSLREREFVQAARALGFGRARIILRHVIPNVMAPIIVTATLGVGNTIILEAGLNFLALGPPPPTPTWGGLVAAGKDTLLQAWWVTTFPGLIIVTVVLAFNLVGDGLRDALDPRLR
jgi:peptide/nickel transport system permease protein